MILNVDDLIDISKIKDLTKQGQRIFRKEIEL